MGVSWQFIAKSDRADEKGYGKRSPGNRRRILYGACGLIERRIRKIPERGNNLLKPGD